MQNYFLINFVISLNNDENSPIERKIACGIELGKRSFAMRLKHSHDADFGLVCTAFAHGTRIVGGKLRDLAGQSRTIEKEICKK
jgi:hypothetical protein